MSLKLIIFFIFAIANNLCVANKEGSGTEMKYSLRERMQIYYSELRHLFHQSPAKTVRPHGMILFTPEKNYTSNSKLIRVNVKNLFKHKEYQLNLVPVKHNVISNRVPMTVMWTVESSGYPIGNYKMSIVDFGGQHIPGKFYQDEKMMAMLQVIEKDGFFDYDGAIGESLNGQVVRPFPQKWKDVIRSSNSIHSSNEEHIVYKRSADTSKEYSKKSEETLYPKLIIVIDYSLFDELGSVEETIQYVSTFWNAVNLKYSVFQKPKVNIMITAIVIVKDSTAAPYIYQAERDVPENYRSIKLNNTILTHGALYYSKQFLIDTQFHNYDGAILMTASKTEYLGLAYLGQICSRLHSFAYIYDVGDYAGVNTAAHELGHLLGIDHDDGNTDCGIMQTEPMYKIGSVMNSFRQRVHEEVWTNCSKQALEKLSLKKESDCLRMKVRDD